MQDHPTWIWNLPGDSERRSEYNDVYNDIRDCNGEHHTCECDELEQYLKWNDPDKLNIEFDDDKLDHG